LSRDPTNEIFLKAGTKIAENIHGTPTVSTTVTASVLNSPAFSTIPLRPSIGTTALTIEYIIARVPNQLLHGQEGKVGSIKSRTLSAITCLKNSHCGFLGPKWILFDNLYKVTLLHTTTYKHVNVYIVYLRKILLGYVSLV
jgi:hypothetical protein